MQLNYLKIIKHEIPARNHMEANNASIWRSLVFMVQDFKTQVIIDIILVILKLVTENTKQNQDPGNYLNNKQIHSDSHLITNSITMLKAWCLASFPCLSRHHNWEVIQNPTRHKFKKKN